MKSVATKPGRVDKFLYDLFKKLTKNNHPLTLDIGCGDSRRSRILRPLISTLIGLDISRNTLREAKKYIKVVLGDANKLPFSDNSFNAVMAFHLIEHLDDDQSFLNEIHRILKDNGLVLLTTPNRKRLTQILYKFITRTEEMNFPMNPEHKREYTKSELYDLFCKSKLKKVHVIPSFLGILFGFFGKRIQIRIKNPSGILSRYCSQWVIWAKKLKQKSRK